MHHTNADLLRLGIVIALLGGLLGFGSHRLSAQVAPPGQESSPAKPESTSTGSVSGHVYRADTGAPLAGAVIKVYSSHFSPRMYSPPAPPPTVRTAQDGSYSFNSLEPDDYDVNLAERTGFLALEPSARRVVIAAGHAVQNVDFRMQPAAAVSGTVHDEFDDPLSGLTAAVYCEDPNIYVRVDGYTGYWETHARTDDRGEFRVSGVRPGRCYVAIAADEILTQGATLKRARFYPDADTMEKAQAIEIKPGQEIDNLRFRFPLALSGTLGALRPAQQILPFPSPGPAMGAVSGHIYRVDTGQPIGGIIIHLHPFRNPDQANGNAAVPSPLAARTGADGAYTFATVEPGTYGIDVVGQGFAPLGLDGSPEHQADPSRVSIAEGQHVDNLDYKLQPSGSISGSARDQDGVPLQGLRVTAYCPRPDFPDAPAGQAGSDMTDDRGDFRISAVPPGNCFLGAVPMGALSEAGYQGVFYPNAAKMDNGQPIAVKPGGDTAGIALVVRYTPTYTLTVRVIENEIASAQHIYSVRLSAPDPAGPPLANPMGRGIWTPETPDPGEDAVIRGVSPGTYKIDVVAMQMVPGRGHPTIRRPDGTIDPRAAGPSHGWSGTGYAAGSAIVQVVDRDVCVQIPTSSLPPSILLAPASPPAAEKCGQTATETASRSKGQREGCNLLPYEGKQPEDQSPSNLDFRGGMVCRFSINPKQPLFTFRFVADGDNPVGKIEVSEGESAKVIQTIPYSGNPASGGLPDPLHNILYPVDANFDGYKDLPLLTGCGAVGNCTYEFYLYDPASDRFVPNSLLSGLIMPEVHPQDKTVTSYTHMSAFDGSGETYQYRNGQYVLIEKWESAWNREKDIVTTKTYNLRDGKMELTKCEGECSQKP